MSAYAWISGGASGELGAVRELLSRVLRNGLAGSVLVPLETADGRSVQPAVVVDPRRLEAANPLLPVLPVNTARMASLLTEHGPAPADAQSLDPAERIAVVMRPCELRATVELAKLNQVRLARLLLIAVDCVGTYEGRAWRKASPDDLALSRRAARQGLPDPPGDMPYRHACSMCVTPVGWQAELSLHTLGVEAADRLLVEAADERLLAALELTGAAPGGEHAAAVEALRSARQARRTTALDEFAGQMRPGQDGRPGLLAAFETCQRCLNCTVACPICYCKACLFRTETFDHEPRRYLDWAGRKGAARLPGDAVAFQLTRLCHVTTSCVGCGLCTSACPADLPVDSLFQTVARATQALFDYVPGRSPDEALPPTAFARDEFAGLGEAPS